MTLDDVMAVILCCITEFGNFLGKLREIGLRQKCRLKNLSFQQYAVCGSIMISEMTEIGRIKDK